jgi:tetratricopeptide (TPR) repeat protein
MADAYRFLDWAYVDLGRPELATNSNLALVAYEELDDLEGQGAVLTNMGSFAFWAGRWGEAQELWTRARDITLKIGNPVDAADDTNNICEILVDQGRLDEAEAGFREALRVFQAAGHRARTAYVKIQLGRTAARMGRFDEASQLLDQAREQGRDVGADAFVLEAEARIAECELLRGRHEEALEAARAASEHARTMGGVASQAPLLERVKGYALLRLGRFGESRDAFDESLTAGRARTADYDVAFTLLGMAELARQTGDQDPSVLEREAATTLDRLGVIRVPEIPPPVAVGAVAGKE